MADWPEFRSDHDPRFAGTANAPAPQRPPLGKRLRAWTILLILFAVVFGSAGGGIFYARHAFRSRSWDDLPLAFGLLLPLGSIVWVLVRTRLRTGRWGGSREERAQRAARINAARPQVQAQARARAGSNGHYILRWAGYAAFEPTCTPWRRTLAWTVLAGQGLYLLLLAAGGVIAIGAGCDGTDTAFQRVLFIGLGLLLLLMPAVKVRALIRRRRAGSVRVTREEFAGLQAQRAAWRMRESQKPLRSKAMSIAFSVAIEVWWWMRVTVFHSRHPRESWVAPLLSLPAFVWVVWVQLRPPKTVDSKQ